MAETNCRKCTDYKGCIGKPFFSYPEIKFCSLQIIWATLHLDELLAGQWATPPDDSSNVNVNPEATFAKAVLIGAEVSYRLGCCGIYGKLLLSQVREMGKDAGIEGWMIQDRLDPEARLALFYCSGYARKEMSFWHWKKQRRYRQKRNDYPKVVKVPVTA